MATNCAVCNDCGKCNECAECIICGHNIYGTFCPYCDLMKHIAKTHAELANEKSDDRIIVLTSNMIELLKYVQQFVRK